MPSESLSGNPAYQDFGISLEFLSGFSGSLEPIRKWGLSGNGAYHTLRGDLCGFVVIWAVGLDSGPGPTPSFPLGQALGPGVRGRGWEDRGVHGYAQVTDLYVLCIYIYLYQTSCARFRGPQRPRGPGAPTLENHAITALEPLDRSNSLLELPSVPVGCSSPCSMRPER